MDQFFQSVSVFLTKMQELDIIKDFSLNSLEECSKIDFSELQPIFQKFVGEVNETFEKINAEPLGSDRSEDKSLKAAEVTSPESSIPPINKSNVQLQADGNEIRRRISAFLTRKRKEVEEWNVQEFCSRPYIDEQNPIWEQMDSCARVDAVFVPRFGSKSHVKVSKVENRWGPQTQLPDSPTKKVKIETIEESSHQKTASIEAAQERIQLMESHLNLNSNLAARNSLYKRIKDLENRILYLEGLSPDYFSNAVPNYMSEKKKNIIEKEKAYSSWSVDDIQKRIQALTESLKSKSQIKMEFPEKF